MKKGKEFIYLESFPLLKGEDRLELISDEIRTFLYSMIHPRKEGFMYHTEVEGHTRLFKPFDLNGELGLMGGQISIFSYTSKKKDEGIVTGVNRTGINAQADAFWEIMDSEEGHIDIHFVYYEGPERKEPDLPGNKPLYDGSEMTAYRIRFRLQRKPSSLIVILYNLKITKECWFRKTKKEKVIMYF